MTFGEMTDADKIMNSQHFGSDPADIRVRIQINPEIGMRIPDWRRITRSGHSLVILNCCLSRKPVVTTLGQPATPENMNDLLYARRQKAGDIAHL